MMLRICAVLISTVLLHASASARTWEVTSDTTDAGQRVTNALLNAAEGDRIHIHAPGPYTAPPGGWIISKSLEIFGDGTGDNLNPSSTFLRPSSGNDPVIVIDATNASSATLENLYIHDLQIGQLMWPGPTSTQPNSYGIYFKWETGDRELAGLRLERLAIQSMANDGIHLDGGNAGITGVSIKEVLSTENAGNGLWIYYSSLFNLVDSYFSRNRMTGARVLSCGAARIMWSAFEENWRGTPDGGTVGQLELASSHAFLAEGNHFEEWDDRQGMPQDPAALTALYVYNTLGGQIGSCSFGNESFTSNSRGIFLGYTAPLSAVVIGPNQFSALDVAIEIQDTPTLTNCVVLPQAHFGQYGPGKIIVPESVDRGHVLIPPTKSGFGGISAGLQFPRLSPSRRDSMTTSASGGTLREGLFIYNDSAKRANYWNGTAWKTIYPDVCFPKTTAANAVPGGMSVPAITTAERNSLPGAYVVAGSLIFNTTTGEMNYFNGTAWRAVTNKNP